MRFIWTDFDGIHSPIKMDKYDNGHNDDNENDNNDTDNKR